MVEYWSATLNLPLPTQVAAALSLIAVVYAIWIVAVGTHDCPKTFAVLFMASSGMFLLLQAVGLVVAVSGQHGVEDDSVFRTSYAQLHRLYDVLVAVISLLALKVLHTTHSAKKE